MKRIITLIGIFLALFHFTLGQSTEELFERLQAITNREITFYNIDGIEITSQSVDAIFSTKNCSKKFKQLKIKEKELTTSDSLLNFQNFYVFKTIERPQGIHNNTAYYFIESTDKKIIVLTFASINKTEKEFERRFVRLVRENAIPQSVFNSLSADNINFAGRKIHLNGNCQWMGINNIQCPYYGQMNWSVHKSLSDASQAINNQFKIINNSNKGKVVSDTTVSVEFEGTETTARRIIYDFTGITSILAGMSGGKTLTIYFVAASVRNNFVSCVMSFWNNDQINPSGLSPLLELVMKLK